jgi:hypothetical protein
VILSENDITYDNVPENYTVKLGSDNGAGTYSTVISGLAEKIDPVTGADLNPLVDLSILTSRLKEGEQLKSGTYAVNMKFSPPEGVSISQDVTVRITVTAPEPEPASDAASTAESQ